VVDRSRAVFDQIVSAVAGAALGDLNGFCGQYGNRVDILGQQADGVPHPAAWYDPTSVFHRTMMGVYHDMQGALINCQQASENGDGYSASVAVGDIERSVHRMRQIDDRVHQLSRGH
jgi:hypothetical protein